METEINAILNDGDSQIYLPFLIIVKVCFI